jgi:folylpolyglutamate synthase/dihydropteroate synthase
VFQSFVNSQACSTTRSELTEVDGPFPNFELENEAVRHFYLIKSKNSTVSWYFRGQVSRAGLQILSRTLQSRGFSGLTDSVIAQALRAVPPCRFEHFSVERDQGVWHVAQSSSSAQRVTVILDVAHNPPAFAQLFRKLQERHPGRPVRVVLGTSKTLDVSQYSRVWLNDFCIQAFLARRMQARVSVLSAATSTLWPFI